MAIEESPDRDIDELIETMSAAVESSCDNMLAETVGNESRQKGASLVEYALLVALIAVVAIAAVRILGQTVSGQFSVINNTITG